MERKTYLELCQKNAVLNEKTSIIHDGVEFFPKSLVIWFDKEGRCKNTANLVAVFGNYEMNVNVEELKGD